jgi:hypothetical protein
MKLLKILTLILCVSSIIFAQTETNNFEWNGYAQFRLYKISDNYQGFMIRRAKLWVKGNVPNESSFRYKVMGIFKYNKTGYFGLLDVYGEFLFSNGHLRFGQQIPEFSLQREQPDWKIPVVERAAVINRLIPAAQTSARDIGLQASWEPINSVLRIAGGVFNGEGSNIKTHGSANFLYTLRSTVRINIVQNYSLSLGSSIMFRKADNADFSLIFGKENLFTGNDFRYGFETLLKLNHVEVQAEYIGADFSGQKAFGYYVYVNLNFSEKDQAVVSAEKLVDLNNETNDDLWIIAGYNHLFFGHKVKLMASGGTQFKDNYTLTAQLQLFFN